MLYLARDITANLSPSGESALAGFVGIARGINPRAEMSGRKLRAVEINTGDCHLAPFASLRECFAKVTVTF